VKEVARACHNSPNTVIKWRQRFCATGVCRVARCAATGRPAVYGEDFRKRVLALLETTSSSGPSLLDGPAVAATLQGFGARVWRVLVSRDPLAATTLLVASAPTKSLPQSGRHCGVVSSIPRRRRSLISVDEKPSIQALERKTGYGKRQR